MEKYTKTVVYDLETVNKTARRVYSLDVFGMRDADATPETIAADIINDAPAVINYLLDIIDDLQS